MDADMMSEKELATYLGLSLSTVRRLRYAGEGPPVTWLGKRPRYRRASVNAWLERQERPDQRK
jgi:excisionase family DNA binding protein